MTPPGAPVPPSPADAEDPFGPEFVAFLASVPDRVRRMRAGSGAGARAVTAPGGAFLLRGHREFRAGDDPRRIDPRVAARLDRLVVREMDAERDARTDVLLDASASMGPLGGRRAAARAAALAFALALADGGRARLLALRPGGPVLLADGSAARDLPAALEALRRETPAGALDLAHEIRVAAAGAPANAAIVLVGDLLGDADPAALASLRARARRGLVIHLRVPEVWAPEPGVACEAVDAETGARRIVSLSPASAARVAAAANAHAARWERAAADTGLRWVRIDPATEPEVLLRALAGAAP